MMTSFQIAGRSIGPAEPPFIVAEVGINHNGRLDLALEMIGAAKAAGADAVKFQTFKASELVSSPEQMFSYRSQGRDITEPMLHMFERHELPADAWRAIKDRCDREGMIFFSTPQNSSDLDLLLSIGVPAVKVGSDDFVNLSLLRSFRESGLPLLLSCGMATLAEVYLSLEAAGAFDGHPVALLLCTSQYPTPAHDVNLRKLETLAGAFPELTLGFSDHTEGALAAPLALALGARIFEKHFTMDHDLPGPDHWFSENPQTLQTWVTNIHSAFSMLGSGVVRPTRTERENIRDFRRVVVAAQRINAGDLFAPANLMLRRHPAGNVTSGMYDHIIGARATRTFEPGEPIEL